MRGGEGSRKVEALYISLLSIPQAGRKRNQTRFSKRRENSSLNRTLQRLSKHWGSLPEKKNVGHYLNFSQGSSLFITRLFELNALSVKVIPVHLPYREVLTGLTWKNGPQGRFPPLPVAVEVKNLMRIALHPQLSCKDIFCSYHNGEEKNKGDGNTLRNERRKR